VCAYHIAGTNRERNQNHDLVGVTTLWGWKSYEPNEVNHTSSDLLLPHPHVSREHGDVIGEPLFQEPGKLDAGFISD
jgi:hypothetical protein